MHFGVTSSYEREVTFAVGAHVNTYDRIVLHQSVVCGSRGDIAARETDHEKPSFESQQAAGNVEIATADGIVDDVDTTPVGCVHDFLI